MAQTVHVSEGTRLRRALRRRCPRCGTGAFDTFFGIKEHCITCGLKFEREPGYWVGAIIINTGVVFGTFVAVFGGMTLATWPDVPWATVLIVAIVANGLIPVAFYPISKTLWLAMEMSWNPLERGEVEEASRRAGAPEWQVRASWPPRRASPR